MMNPNNVNYWGKKKMALAAITEVPQLETHAELVPDSVPDVVVSNPSNIPDPPEQLKGIVSYLILITILDKIYPTAEAEAQAKDLLVAPAAMTAQSIKNLLMLLNGFIDRLQYPYELALRDKRALNEEEDAATILEHFNSCIRFLNFYMQFFLTNRPTEVTQFKKEVESFVDRLARQNEAFDQEETRSLARATIGIFASSPTPLKVDAQSHTNLSNSLFAIRRGTARYIIEARESTTCTIS